MSALRLNGIGLLLRRELSRLDRAGGRRRLVRAFTLLVLALFVVGSLDLGPQAPFRRLVGVQLTLFLFLQPVRAAGIFVEGRLDGTLSLLGVTPLRPAAIWLGTCAAALALALEGLLLGLPLLSIAAAYGGLPPADLLRAAATLVVGACFGTAIGAWVGSNGRRREGGAFLRALSWTLLYLVASLILLSLAEFAQARGHEWVMTLANACWLPGALEWGQPRGWLSLLGPSLVIPALFLHGTYRLRRTILQGEGPQLTRRQTKAGAVSRPVPEVGALAWREAQRQDPGGWVRPGFLAVAGVVLFFGMTIAGVLAARGANPTAVPVAQYCLLLLACTLWLLLVVWGLMSGARSYVEDREDGSLELILTTTRYTLGRVASEKLWGALRRGRWGIAAGGLLHAGAFVWIGLSNDAAAPALVSAAASVVGAWVLAAGAALALGQLFSVSAPSSVRAQAWAAGSGAVFFFVGIFSACMVNAFWVLPGMVSTLYSAVLVHLVVGGVALGIGALAQVSIRSRLPRLVGG